MCQIIRTEVGHIIRQATLNTLGPYFWPSGDFGWTFVTFFGEIVFMIWLLVRGWKIREAADVSVVKESAVA